MTPRPVGYAAAPDDEFLHCLRNWPSTGGRLAFVPGDDAAGDEAGYLDGELQGLSWRSSMNRQKTAPGRRRRLQRRRASAVHRINDSGIALVSVEARVADSQAVPWYSGGWGACSACSSAGCRSSTGTSVISASNEPGAASVERPSNCPDTGEKLAAGERHGAGPLGVRRTVRLAASVAGWGGAGWALAANGALGGRGLALVGGGAVAVLGTAGRRRGPGRRGRRAVG